jgi:hypothetical protein
VVAQKPTQSQWDLAVQLTPQAQTVPQVRHHPWPLRESAQSQQWVAVMVDQAPEQLAQVLQVAVVDLAAVQPVAQPQQATPAAQVFLVVQHQVLNLTQPLVLILGLPLQG